MSQNNLIESYLNLIQLDEFTMPVIPGGQNASLATGATVAIGLIAAGHAIYKKFFDGKANKCHGDPQCIEMAKRMAIRAEIETLSGGKMRCQYDPDPTACLKKINRRLDQIAD